MIEPVTDRARRYDGTILFWNEAWGPARDVVVAVNFRVKRNVHKEETSMKIDLDPAFNFKLNM
jgi:hypothetical protein